MRDQLLNHPMRSLVVALLGVIVLGVVWYELSGGAAGKVRRDTERIVAERAERLAAFTTAVDAGMPCSGLYELRNTETPGDPNVPLMNEALREIGCYLSTSTRTD